MDVEHTLAFGIEAHARNGCCILPKIGVSTCCRRRAYRHGNPLGRGCWSSDGDRLPLQLKCACASLLDATRSTCAPWPTACVAPVTAKAELCDHSMLIRAKSPRSAIIVQRLIRWKVSLNSAESSHLAGRQTLLVCQSPAQRASRPRQLKKTFTRWRLKLHNIRNVSRSLQRTRTELFPSLGEAIGPLFPGAWRAERRENVIRHSSHIFNHGRKPSRIQFHQCIELLCLPRSRPKFGQRNDVRQMKLRRHSDTEG